VSALDHDPDEPVAVLNEGSGHDGHGWYYWDEECPGEGSCGAFETLGEALVHASDGYKFVRLRGKVYPIKEAPES
jgi:hypothetical protein